MLKKSPKPDVALISVPDQATADYVCRVLKDKDVAYGDVLIGAKGLSVDSAPLTKSDLPIFLVVPSVAQGAKQIALAKRFAQSGGVVFVWGLEHSSKNNAVDDGWLLERLLEQTLAIVSESLGPIALAVKILVQLGAKPPFRVQTKGKTNALTKRLSDALKSFGIYTTRKGVRTLAASLDGDGVTLSQGSQKLAPFDIYESIGALALISKLRSKESPPKETDFQINTEEAYSIARPPARLLSEATSKRLISYFGISLPNEQLCKSAAQASRFAASFEGPAVIKLTRPAFENKTSVGAVRFDVLGHAAVRREVASLELLGRSLGPPEALGYLVSEQVQVEDGIWAKMLDSQKLGRILILGPLDKKIDGPTAALAAPATTSQAIHALKRADSNLSAESLSKLAVAMVRFSRMVHKLGDCIDRAEIDSLVALSTRKEALALDALVGVSGRR